MIWLYDIYYFVITYITGFSRLSFYPPFFPLLPLFLLAPIPWQCGYVNVHIIPFTPLLLFLFILPFFLPICSLHFLPNYFKWYLDYINQTFRSEIAKDPQKWGKLDHWRIVVLLSGHMFFHSISVVGLFCPMVLIHVGALGIPAPKLRIKVYYSDSFNVFLSKVGVIILE